MNNKPWKKWKTSKLSFIGVVTMWAVFIIAKIVFACFGIDIPEDLTSFILEAGQWVLVTGTTVVVASKVTKKKDEVE